MSKSNRRLARRVMKRERQSQISRINTTEFPGGRESNVAEPVCFPENSWLIRCANGAAFLQIPSQASLQMSFQKLRLPACRALSRAFLNANFDGESRDIAQCREKAPASLWRVTSNWRQVSVRKVIQIVYRLSCCL